MKTFSHKDDKNLLEFWSNVLQDKGKNRVEFYGRVANPTTDIAPLYTNLKIEETSGKGMRYIILLISIIREKIIIETVFAKNYKVHFVLFCAICIDKNKFQSTVYTSNLFI